MGGRPKKGGVFGRKRHSAAPVPTFTLPPPSPHSVLERLDQFDLRLRQLEENQIRRQPPAPPPPPPPAPTSSPPLPAMRQSCFPAELRTVAKASSLGYAEQKQPQQHLQRQHEQRHDPLQQPEQSSSSSMSSALRETSIRGSLMDRLRLLESRILRLSLELDYRNSNSGASSSITTLTSASDNAWVLQSATSSSVGEQMVVAPPPPPPQRFTVGAASKRLGFGERLQANMSKVKKPKDPKQVLEAAEKKASNKCKEDKKIGIERTTRIYKRWFPVIGC